MDIGTNSVRLLVARVRPGGTWDTLAAQKQVVRLGEGEFAGGKDKSVDSNHAHSRLTRDAIERGALVCQRFAEVARGFGASEIIALATAAVREADNGDDFVERVRQLADLDVRVISGQEEARLIFWGVMSGVDLPSRKNALLIDIGGGSTELSVGSHAGHLFLDSLRMGAIRLTAEYVPHPDRPVPPAVWAALQKHVRSALAPAARAIARDGFSVLYGSSGTIINLAEMAAHALPAPVPTSFRNYSLSLTDLGMLTRRLCALPLSERRRVPGINPERGDIIIGGAAILQTVMETVGASSVRVSDRGLSQGILIDRLRREGERFAPSVPVAPSPQPPPPGDRERGSKKENILASLSLSEGGGGLPAPTVRARSIRALMDKTGVDAPHAAHISHLALSLFDEWKRLSLHEYGRARELLQYAADLHDCGFFVAHTDHQQHSYYLIRHSELLGFNDREVEIIASVALYHRKAAPRARHAAFAKLDAKTGRVIKVLSCALRLAEALDRSHLALVRGVTCQRLTKPDRVRLTLDAPTDAQLEVWAAEWQAPVFEKTFGCPLEVALSGNTGTAGGV